MYEIRFHGRGGQGTVTATNLLAVAASLCGYYVRSFPLYGPERRGAPVMGFLQIDQQPVRRHCAISEPDCVLVIDPRLSTSSTVIDGLKKNGLLILNTNKHIEEVEIHTSIGRLVTVDATKIAKEILKQMITNTATLGAFARGYSGISLESVMRAIEQRMQWDAAKNVEAVRVAYEQAQVRDFI